MRLRKKYFFLLICIALPSVAFGQAAQSPFSTFGLGQPYGNALIQSQGMGGVGVSQPQYWMINNQNPALLVFNYYTSYQAGALVESRTIKTDSLSQKSVSGNLNYLVIALPIKQGKWTTSVGLMPFTNVNYKLSYGEAVIRDDNGTPIDTAGVLERGDGGLTQLYWSNGVRINQDFSVGLKAAYLFGSVNRDYANAIAVPNQPSAYIVGIKEQTYTKDFMFSGGLSYSKDSLFKKNYRFSVGLVYGFGTKLKAHKTTVLERRDYTGKPTSSDTLIDNRGNLKIPSSLTVGLSFGRGGRWSTGAEFSVQDWSNFKNINDQHENLEKMWRFSFGGEITPDGLANNYLKRITYRAGMSYEKDPFKIEQTAGSGIYKSPKDIGINFGLSLPTRISSLDLGARIGRRGDKKETVFEEKYFKIYFGITFNDKWFIKRRFD